MASQPFSDTRLIPVGLFRPGDIDGWFSATSALLLRSPSHPGRSSRARPSPTTRVIAPRGSILIIRPPILTVNKAFRSLGNRLATKGRGSSTRSGKQQAAAPKVTYDYTTMTDPDRGGPAEENAEFVPTSWRQAFVGWRRHLWGGDCYRVGNRARTGRQLVRTGLSSTAQASG